MQAAGDQCIDQEATGSKGLTIMPVMLVGVCCLHLMERDF
jgi:hypothetical protein